MLSTCVTEFPLRNGSDDAAEQGPRYNDGGNTSETESWCLPMVAGSKQEVICIQVIYKVVGDPIYGSPPEASASVLFVTESQS